MNQTEYPLLVQPDCTVLLETNHSDFPTIRSQLSTFAELVKTPPNLHTYRLTAISLWNAAAGGSSAEELITFLQTYCKYGINGVPFSVIQFIRDCMNNFDIFRLEQGEGYLILRGKRQAIMDKLIQYPSVKKMLLHPLDRCSWAVDPQNRGLIKQTFIRLGYPVSDLAGYQSGNAFSIPMRDRSVSGKVFELRDYQKSAVQAFHRSGSMQGGSGILILPCGAGKTIVGIGVMASLNCEVLILTTNTTSVKQWKNEILDKTWVAKDHIGEYTGQSKDVRPITIATYQILTYRKTKQSVFAHMQLFQQRNWGLIIYDEVHLLPAPIFRATADIQATRRLGLTATLIREDGLHEDVFSLVGPKKYEVPWKELERKGWIAQVSCMEIRVPMSENTMQQYERSSKQNKFRIACENPQKEEMIESLLARHQGLPILIIGQYLNQLQRVADRFHLPILTGKTPEKQRQSIYKQFRQGSISGLVVSKVANFALDLPEAAVLIQISGSFGSRQEEAQRLGRILRPKSGGNKAYFYTLVSKQTVEQDYAMKRQLFLVEQGYPYKLIEPTTLLSIKGR